MNKSNDDQVHGAVGRGADASAPSWTPATIFPTLMTPDCGPRCTRFNGADWAVWQGSLDDALWYSTNTGGGWNLAYGLNVSTKTSPAITEYDGKLYLFWITIGMNRVNYATYDGSEWTTGPGYYIPGSNTACGPAAVSWNGKLYVAWSSSDDNTLSYSSFDGQNWHAPQTTSYTMLDAPALAVHNNTLYGAITAYADGSVVSLRYANGSWVNAGSVSGGRSKSAPALASDGKKLMLMWEDTDSTNLTTSTLTNADSQIWAPPTGTASGMTTGISPGMCGDSTGFLAVWRYSRNKIPYSSTLASS